MYEIYRTIVSLWTWLAFGVTLLVFLPLLALAWLVTAPFDSGRYIPGRIFRKVAVIMAAANPLWNFRRSGYRVENPRRPYVVVSNHESFVDIVLISHLPWEMKWLSKREMFRIPIVGWMMTIAGDIGVWRGQRASGAQALRECADRLRKRVSVMIFPEGTRSTKDDLLPFRDGAFRLAIAEGVPVLPLVVHGTRDALQKHNWRFRKARAEVRVLPPVETAGLTAADADDLKQRIRGMIIAGREQLRREHAIRDGNPGDAAGAGGLREAEGD